MNTTKPITDAEIVALLARRFGQMEDDWKGRKVGFAMDLFGRRFDEVLERLRCHEAYYSPLSNHLAGVKGKP